MWIKERNNIACMLNEYGGIVIRSIIVLLTLLIVGISIFGLLNNVGKKQQIYHRKALAVSEYGLMKAMQKVKTGMFEFVDVPKTECDEGWYSISFKKFEKKDTVFLLIISRGFFGSTSETRECTLRLDKCDTVPTWVQHHSR